MGSAEKEGFLWNQAPDDWASLQEPFHAPLWNEMLSKTEVDSKTTFLDAGCGGGGASELAFKKRATVYGIDASEGLINYAKRRLPKAYFQTGDIEALPFKDGMFDVVFAANSIQYAENRVKAVKELSRVCKNDGSIVFGLFGPPEKVEMRFFFKALGEILPSPPHGDGPFGLSFPGKLENLINEGELNVRSAGEVNCPFFYNDFDSFWKANASAGPVRGAISLLGEQKIKEHLLNCIGPFQTEKGIEITPNFFRWVVASK